MANIYSVMAGWQVVVLAGPDSQDYLQRMSTADLRGMRPGRFTPAMLLSPTGKIQLYFKTLLIEKDRFLLLVPELEAGQPAASHAYDVLERMHFRENLTIAPQPDDWTYLRIIGDDLAGLEKLKPSLPGLSAAANSPRGHFEKDETGIFMNEGKWTAPPMRFDVGMLVTPVQLTGGLRALEEAGFTEATSLESYRLRALDPAAGHEITTATMPLELQLDDAVHENKGCYPGQEVIERIRSMGQSPRLLVQVRADGAPPAAPQPILAGEQEAGQLTSAAVDELGGGWIGLGLIKRVFAKDGTSYTIGKSPVHAQFKK